ncbi:uncharacterized protein EKO05_0007983 [Ascochyta rabiei]|nr:uncharacterized protein EKO05_0007983 [Ascochyta rabiei]UPX17641.1 hypothetical protein EKO05_0007983 [Ascochyta rabiei]
MHERSLLDAVQRWRRPKYSARPFALTLVAIALITLLAWAKEHHTNRPGSARSDRSGSLRRRDVTMLDEECRLVHHAVDQCAFVLANCPDEEAGVISYLTLYYCRLPHAKPVAFAIMTLWLALLFSTIGIAASDFFCVNLNTIASMLGMSESLAGVTLLAFGNGSPDVFSTFAAFRTHAASLAVGELIGAASFITAVVSGSMALIRPFNVARKSFVRDVGFFIVAAGFSMGFIVDGRLHLWEAVTMVAFYLFYVVFVVAWHWSLNQRKARRLKAAATRSHYVTPGGEEEEIADYFDDVDDDEAPPANARTPSRGVSIDDFNALERGGADPLNADENEEERERWMGEMSSNMRVSRPPLGARRPTQTAIRPSLVGALEFRAVLSSLQKSRNIQSMPISLRRYSDDPTYTTAQQQDLISTTSDPAPRPPFDVASVSSGKSPGLTRPTLEVQQSMNRTRAVSTNDLDNVRLHPSTLQGNLPHISLAPATPDFQGNLSSRAGHAPPSPTISLSPPPSHMSWQAPSRTRGYSDLLAPPGLDSQGLSQRSTPTQSPLSSPVLRPDDGPAPPNLKLSVPGAASPPIPFPAYTDFPWSAHSSSRAPSLRLPSPSASPESAFHNESLFGVYDVARTPSWWPCRLLPAPHLFLSTLFPTLTSWRDKNVWDKLLGLVAALPVFLLTITLPVVEPASNEDDDDQAGHPDFGLPPALTPVGGTFDSQYRLDGSAPASRSNTDPSKRQKSASNPNGSSYASHNTTGSQPPQVLITTDENLLGSPEALPEDPLSAHGHPSSKPKEWNRWLVIIQTFTAPFFIVLVVWANVEPDSPHALVRQTMYSSVASLVLVAFLLVTTTPTRAPRWRQLLCFVGFAVAIAWISTIANEVVGVLRTLGVILNMSDAILGLTIFAVGNSLGDLVADMTVARLGFPVMALSACFGGPMLNILLGIGLAGCYMILTKGEHRHERHPSEPVHFKPYHIAVSTTLVISGASLLVTLAGLLVAVPVRRWRMDKWIGWGLLGTWCVSTAANVLVEVLGFSSDVS